jgi:hypothetical protein
MFNELCIKNDDILNIKRCKCVFVCVCVCVCERERESKA